MAFNIKITDTNRNAQDFDSFKGTMELGANELGILEVTSDRPFTFSNINCAQLTNTGGVTMITGVDLDMSQDPNTQSFIPLIANSTTSANEVKVLTLDDHPPIVLRNGIRINIRNNTGDTNTYSFDANIYEDSSMPGSKY